MEWSKFDNWPHFSYLLFKLYPLEQSDVKNETPKAIFGKTIEFTPWKLNFWPPDHIWYTFLLVLLVNKLTFLNCFTFLRLLVV